MAATPDALYEEALDLLADGEAENAARRGDELIRAGDPRGYEIGAMALSELERPEEAATLLERGTAAHPDRWLLWQLHGNALSDLGRPDAAVASYDRALALPDADRDSLAFNRALSRARAGDAATAERDLRTLLGGPFALRAAALLVAVLRDAGRIDEALAAADETLAKAGPDTEEVGGRGELLAELAETRLRARDDREGAEAAAREALLDEAHPLALEILRELRGAMAPGARFRRITAEGRLPQGPDAEPLGFYRVYEVIAPSAGEALELARDVEPPPSRASLRLVEHEEGEAAGDECLGVVAASEYLLFDEVRD